MNGEERPNHLNVVLKGVKGNAVEETKPGDGGPLDNICEFSRSRSSMDQAKG